MATTYSRTLLVLNLNQNLSDVYEVLPHVETAAYQTTVRLVIVLVSDAFNADKSRTESWDTVQSVLTSVYVEAARIAYRQDRILLDVDVLLAGKDKGLRLKEKEKDWDVVLSLYGGTHNPSLGPDSYDDTTT